MFSFRFKLDVHVTRHANMRMVERNVYDDILFDLIETGTVKYKDCVRLWLFKSYENRDDNLICAAVSLEDRLIVKTIMHHFDPEG